MKKNYFSLRNIISYAFILALTISHSFSQQQQHIVAKRIEITNPSRAQLVLIKDAGFDLGCGAFFKDNNLILEVGQQELNTLDAININYTVTVDDLIARSEEITRTQLPIAKAQLEQEKMASASRQSLSTSNVTVDNLIQYEGCDEIDWTVPTNFHLGSMQGCLTYSEMLTELDEMRAYSVANGLNIISLKIDASPGTVTHGNSFTNGPGSTVYDSWAGQPVYYVRISDNADSDEVNEPESLYSGMTHSREVSSMMNLIYYMWYVLENYSTDAGIKNLVDNHAMYFVPVANPDGLMWNEQIAPSGGGMQRKNLGPYNTGDNAARGVDLNRNYNYFYGPTYNGSSNSTTSDTYRGPNAFSEPETQIVRDFSATRNFKTAMNHHATSNLIPHAYNGNPNAPASGREAEYAKFCHDMTRFNRYIYGEAPDILTIANGDMSDWMLGGAPDVNGETGSGQGILALAPENGAWDGSEGGFYPDPADIVPIAKRAMRMNFANVYHSGKFAQVHDFNTSDVIVGLFGDFKFGIEYIGQTLGDITLNVTPVSANITSITPPVTQTGWSKLEQRTVTAAYALNSGIQANDKIEFQITLSNDDGYVMYQANIIKYYDPSVLFSDNPDVTGTSNWTTSGGTWGTTTDGYDGSIAITDSPSGAYGNNVSKSITLNTATDLTGVSQAVVQFYAKWDLERNFDYVQLQGSTNGSTWTTLCGKYTKPGSDYLTNRYSSGNSSNTTDPSRSSTTNQPSGASLYDGDTMDKWVMEEIFIDGSNNSFLFQSATAQFRFVLDSDNTNRADGYPTTFDGFIFDDFKVIDIQIPCVEAVPTGLIESAVGATSATIGWDAIPSTTYDLRYRVTGSGTWIDVLDLTTNSYDLIGLTANTPYDVQVRSKCGPSASAYTATLNFTTTTVNYCASLGNNAGATDEWIGNVTIGAINNTTGNDSYTDYTSQTTDLDKNTTPSISVTKAWSGTNWAEGIAVWIDFNQDGDFDDTGEAVVAIAASATPVTASENITIPAGAPLGNTRMRVSMKYNGLPTSCESFQYGEVEDYTVNIIDPTLSVEDLAFDNVSIYPNPFNDSVSVKFANNFNQEIAVSLYDISGRILFKKDYNSTNNVTIDGLNKLTVGTYFIKINDKNNGASITKSLLKQ